MDTIRALPLLVKLANARVTKPVIVDGTTQAETIPDKLARTTKSANRGLKSLAKGKKQLKGGFNPILAAISAVDDLDLILRANENGTTFGEEWEKEHGDAEYFLPLGLPFPFPNPDTAKSQRNLTGYRGRF
jgi:hypothetical protein